MIQLFSKRLEEFSMTLLASKQGPASQQRDDDVSLLPQGFVLLHIRYLQDEYANLVVLGKYPKETAQMFRSLQQNTSGLNSEVLRNLKLAVEVTGQQSQVQQGNSSTSSLLRRGIANISKMRSPYSESVHSHT